MAKKKSVSVSIEFPDIDLKIEKIKLIEQPQENGDSFFFLVGKDYFDKEDWKLIFANIELLTKVKDSELDEFVVDFVREDDTFTGFQLGDVFVPVTHCTQVKVKDKVIEVSEATPGCYRFTWSERMFDDTTEITKVIIRKE